MDSDRLQKLLDGYFDEVLDVDTANELEQMLLSSPRAREIFWEQAEMHAMLRQVGQESWGSEAIPDSELIETPLEQISPQTGSSAWLRVAAVAATIACVAAVAFFLNAKTNAPVAGSGSEVAQQSLSGEAESDPGIAASEDPSWVAVMSREVDVHWDQPSEAMIAGEAMPPRRIKFNSGLLEIQTNRGVLITLEGPADLEVVSGMEVVCHKGRLRVDVPPQGLGFVVRTRQFDVVDRGTIFAVDIDGGEKSEVHVLKGLVEIVSDNETGETKRELREGEAVGITGGVYKNISSDGAAFPSPKKLSEFVRAAELRQHSSWQRKQKLLKMDPSCLVYLDFQEKNGTPDLINNAIGADPENDGVIVGAQRSQGRWPEKGGLELRNDFDRVLLAAPGEHQSLTCLASVRLDMMNSASVSLLAPTDAIEGSFRWEIEPPVFGNPEASLRLLRQSKGSWEQIGSATETPFLRQTRLGTWIQVAFVWDGVNQSFDQYVNGKLLSHEELPDKQGLTLGQMEIGKQLRFPSESMWEAESFVGCIDEFAILNRALSFQEIRVHQIGARASWSNSTGDGDWSNARNWFGLLEPSAADTIFVDRHGKDAAIYNEDSQINFSSVRVGTGADLQGELRISGGSLNAYEGPAIDSRIGSGGGEGKILQQHGSASIGALRIGLGTNSRGVYRLEGGELTIFRLVNNESGSIAIGLALGTGRMEIAGGSLTTRGGVFLGKNDGVGSFVVEGSKADQIDIGSFDNKDGFWVQESGSTLAAKVDVGGVTPVVIHDTEDTSFKKPYVGGDVTFAKGSILDVDFAGEPMSGNWDLMKWDGELFDHGLQFSESVDQEVWSFLFVDTDSSGSPDTLRIIAAKLK